MGMPFDFAPHRSLAHLISDHSQNPFFFLSLAADFLQTRLTLCEGEDGTESSNGDVLIFPDMIRYRLEQGINSNHSPSFFLVFFFFVCF